MQLVARQLVKASDMVIARQPVKASKDVGVSWVTVYTIRFFCMLLVAKDIATFTASDILLHVAIYPR